MYNRQNAYEPEPPEDPLREEAEILTDLQLEDIQDDLDDEAYRKLWMETKEAEYKRLVAEREAEIDAFNNLSPEEQDRFLNGPTAEEMQRWADDIVQDWEK